MTIFYGVIRVFTFSALLAMLVLYILEIWFSGITETDRSIWYLLLGAVIGMLLLASDGRIRTKD